MKLQRIVTNRSLLKILILMLGLALPVQATVRSWTGAASNDSDWSNAFNWAANGLPVAGDDLQFPDNASHAKNTDDFPAGRTFNSIAFFHGGSAGNNHGYIIDGNSIALNAGISVMNNNIDSWPIAISNAFILNSNQTFSAGTLTSLAAAGTIDLNGKDLTIDNASGSPVNLSGVISGAGGLIKNNAGTLTLWSNNTYTGSTALHGGVLEILGSQPASSLQLYAGTLHAGSAVGDITALGSGGAGTIVLSPGINAGSLSCSNLTLNASTTFVADLADPLTGGGYDQLNVNGTVALSNATLSVALQYAPSVGTSFFIIKNDGGDAIGGIFNGLPEGSSITNNGIPFRISYTGGDGNDVVLTVLGATRTWSGGGANSFWTTPGNWVGGVAPSPGDDLVFPQIASQLTTSNNFPAGTLFNSITCYGGFYNFYGSSIVLHAGLTVSNTAAVTPYFYIPLTLDADQAITIDNQNVSLFLFGDINTGGKNLTFAGSGNAQVDSVISGAGGLIKFGAGTTLLYSSNTFSGPVQIYQGQVSIYNGHALGETNGSTTVYAAGALELANIITVPEPIVVAGVLQSSGEVILTGPVSITDSNALLRVVASETLAINGLISGNTGLNKTGQGKLVLNANNTYTGLTFLNGGTLLVNSSQSNSPVFIYSDTFPNAGTLGGTGTVGTLSIGGPFTKTIAPGNSGPGILTFNISGGDSATIFSMELNGTTPGSGYDQIKVNTSFAPNNASLSLSLGFAPALGDTFVIIKNDGSAAIFGTFAGLPQGALLTNGAAIFRISYTGGDGNDVTLTRTLGAPPATLTSIVSLSNRYEQLTGQGISNLTYTIQAAGNLNPPIQWSNIGAPVANSGGVFAFTDTNAALFPMRFYRVVSP